ncbi:MAG: hypothetical protein D6714_19760 [Bacteroidetes bacterium]|nr:MAG: hypothetical protein D6714_19760 [Bacteroidota bacterium]
MSKRAFLENELPALLAQLKPDAEPRFGLMTPQHMVEHLTWTIKSSIKRNGEPQNPPTEKQLGFQKFIKNGAVLQHRPSNKTKADLPPLRYGSLEEAAARIPEAVARFYATFDENPEHKAYSDFFGELGFEDLEQFTYMHARYHLWQFGLLEKYP